MFIALSSCSHVEDQPYLIVFLWTQDPLLSFNLVLVVTGIYFGTFFSHYLWLLTDGAVVIVDLDFFIISTCWPLNGSRMVKFWDILTRRSTVRRDPLYYILTRRSTARRDSTTWLCWAAAAVECLASSGAGCFILPSGSSTYNNISNKCCTYRLTLHS